MIHISTIIDSDKRLSVAVIEDWVARGWVQVDGAAPDEWTFTEIAASRLYLLWDLHVDLALDDEAVPVVLSLLDQVYALRGTLRSVIGALDDAPDDLKQRIVAAIKRPE